jgi:outer membrane protein TolC
MTQPSKPELYAVLDQAETRLARLLGRWDDELGAPLRLEIRRIHRPILEVLLKAGRR